MGKLIELLHRCVILASRIAFVDGNLDFTTDPDPLVAGEVNYTLTFTREHSDPENFNNVDLLFGDAIITQFPLNFPAGVHTQGPFSGATDHFIFSTPGCVFMYSQHTYDKVYPF
jgi:hypothetical protein